MRNNILAAVLAASLCAFSAPSLRGQDNYDTPSAQYPYRVVVLSDLHATVKRPALKNVVIRDVNSWKDVALVAVTGDISYFRGTLKEFTYGLQLLRSLRKYVCAITGNHDYIYNDKKGKGKPNERAAKLKRFQKALSPMGLYYTQPLGRYLLVFLSVDSLTSKNLVKISPAQLKWFNETLRDNPDSPTIVFFHAPLLPLERGGLDRDDYFAQEEINNIVRRHKQVFLWVSGHTHTPPDSKKFTDPYKVFGRVLGR